MYQPLHVDYPHKQGITLCVSRYVQFICATGAKTPPPVAAGQRYRAAGAHTAKSDKTATYRHAGRGRYCTKFLNESAQGGGSVE
jgi:hypothetical protein